jgi:hypothetical protein
VPPQQYRPVEQPNFQMEQRGIPQPEVHQEVDMNDEQMADTRGNAPAMAAGSFGGNNISSHSGVPQPQKVDLAVAALSDRTDSVSSYNPPSATPPESGETPIDLRNGAQSTDLQAAETNKYQGRGAFEMRELAKGALLSLAPHNIRYSDLLAEGIDEQLLSQLFEEVGLKTTLNTPVKPPSSSTQTTVNSGAAQHPLNNASAATPLASEAQSSTGLGTKAALASTPVTGQTMRQPISTPGNTPLAVAKAANIPPSASPTMERKDVIAAMLAAKMGKQIPRKESPGVASPGLPVKPTQLTSPSVSNVMPSSSQPMQDVALAAASQAVPDEASNKLTSKPRSMAKTELVLQKMEQLKQQTAAKAQSAEVSQQSHSLSQSTTASRSTSGLASGLSSYSQAGLPPKPVSQEVVMDGIKLPLATNRMVKQSSLAAAPPPIAKFASSIPGLFMTDADRDPESTPSPEVRDAIVHSTTQVAKQIGPIQSTDGARAQELVALDSDAARREASSSRTPSKRPLAVDTFDDHYSPPAKLQDSRSISSRENESITSDRYSDDISEGEIMEIDEGSPVSPLPRAPSYRSYHNSSDVGATWPAANTNSSPIMQRHEAANGSEWTEAGTRPAFAGQRALAPSKHEIELETMKKKLAEAEERRKAKQNAPQLQSPSSLRLNQSSNPPSSSTAALTTAGAVSVNGSKLQHSPQPTPVVQGKSQGFSTTSQSNSPRSSAPIDPMQRASELREKLLRQRMLKQGLPELDKEVQKTQNRQAEAQARLAQLRREAEKREEEAREARKREQEILEEVRRLEEQLEMGMNGQQQFSQEMETLDQEISPQAIGNAEQKAELQPSINEVPSISGSTAGDIRGDETLDTFVDDQNEVTPAHAAPPESGDSISDSEDERMRQDYNDRLVRPSAEAALPTAEEEAAFLEPATADHSVSDEEGLISPDDSDHHEEADVSPQDKVSSDSDDSPMEVDSDSDGSASMSDSGSEDYQPAEPITVTSVPESIDDEDEEYDPMDAPVSGAQPFDHEEDRDDYEPSEVVEPVEVQTTPLMTGSPVSNGITSENEPEHGDDREHALELTEANTLTYPQEILPSVPDAADTNNVRTRPSYNIV